MADERPIDLPDEIYAELEKISKMKPSIDQFNRMAEASKGLTDQQISKDKSVIEKDTIQTVLSSKEKTRYRNLGKAFMAGSSSALEEIKKAQDLKDKMSISNRNTEMQKIVADNKKKMEMTEKKKSVGLVKLLAGAAALGAIYYIFKDEIDAGVSRFVQKAKDELDDFSQNILKYSKDIQKFFGRLFIEGTSSLSPGGLMSRALIGVVSHFFDATLPELVKIQTQELVRTVDRSFVSDAKLDTLNDNKTIDDLEKSVTQRGNLLNDSLSVYRNSLMGELHDVVGENIKLTRQEQRADLAMYDILTRYNEQLKEANDSNQDMEKTHTILYKNIQDAYEKHMKSLSNTKEYIEASEDKQRLIAQNAYDEIAESERKRLNLSYEHNEQIKRLNFVNKRLRDSYIVAMDNVVKTISSQERSSTGWYRDTEKILEKHSQAVRILAENDKKHQNISDENIAMRNNYLNALAQDLASVFGDQFLDAYNKTQSMRERQLVLQNFVQFSQESLKGMKTELDELKKNEGEQQQSIVELLNSIAKASSDKRVKIIQEWKHDTDLTNLRDRLTNFIEDRRLIEATSRFSDIIAAKFNSIHNAINSTLGSLVTSIASQFEYKGIKTEDNTKSVIDIANEALKVKNNTNILYLFSADTNEVNGNTQERFSQFIDRSVANLELTSNFLQAMGILRNTFSQYSSIITEKVGTNIEKTDTNTSEITKMESKIDDLTNITSMLSSGVSGPGFEGYPDKVTIPLCII